MKDLPIGVVILDFAKDFKVIECNKAILDLFMIKSDKDNFNTIYTYLKVSLLKQNVRTMLNDDGMQHNAELTGQLPFTDFLQTINNSLGKSHGFIELESDRLVEIRVKKGIYEDKDVIFVTFMDCSIVQRLEKAKTENRCKTLIMSTVSHELRAPVNAVLGSLETIAQYVPPEGQTYVELAKSSCHMLTYQIDDLTDYGKVSDDKLVLNKGKVDLDEIISECMSLVSWQAKGKKILILYTKSEDAPKNIIANARRLRQVLLNLLTNAIKFTDKGQISIIVKKSFGDVKIRVKDTGMGIKPEDLPKLFKEFEMLEMHRSINPNGTGLGLYLSKKLVNEMRGDITVKSIIGEGSTFTIVLPLPQEKTSSKDIIQTIPLQSSELIIEMSETKRKCKCKKVLAVDDNDTNLLVIVELLKRYGILCDTARNGQDAIQLVKKRKEEGECCLEYKLIFMDCYMPGMSGFDAAKEIRKTSENQLIVALTGENPEDVEEIAKKNFNEVLTKPISLHKVGDVLARYHMIKK